MIEKNFKNRLIYETPQMIRKLKSLWIDGMGQDLKNNTPNGLYAFTITPDRYVDEVELEKSFRSILSHYYKWKYGSKYKKLPNSQTWFEGVIERQVSGIPHIHITIYQYDVVELSIFVSYIIKMFKSLYHKSSHKIKKVYDLPNWKKYISEFPSRKDTYKTKKRIVPPTYISSELFGAIYTN